MKKNFRIIDIKDLAKRIARAYGFPRADDYNLVYREFDRVVEVIGLVNDPNVTEAEVEAEGVKFPKSWVTIGTLPGDTSMKYFRRF